MTTNTITQMLNVALLQTDIQSSIGAVNWNEMEQEIRKNPQHLKQFSHAYGSALHCLCYMGCPTSILIQALNELSDEVLLKTGGRTGKLPLHLACQGSDNAMQPIAASVDNIRVLLGRSPYAASIHARNATEPLPIQIYLRSFNPKLDGVRLLLDAHPLGSILAFDVACLNVAAYISPSSPWSRADQPTENDIHTLIANEELKEINREEYWKILEFMILQRERIYTNGSSAKSAVKQAIPASLSLYRYHLLPKFLQRNVNRLLEQNMLGNSPIHAICRYSNRKPRPLSIDYHSLAVLREILTAEPKVASVANREGRLPLYTAIQSGYMWGLEMELLSNAATTALRTRDMQTRLYPFMEAAIVEHECCLDSVFSLLRKDVTAAKGLAKVFNKRKRKAGVMK